MSTWVERIACRKQSKQLLRRIQSASENTMPLSRPEFRLVSTSGRDMRKLAPFLMVLVIAPELIPFLLVFAPGMIPSTCILPDQELQRRKKIKERRDALAESVMKTLQLELVNAYTTDDFTQDTRLIRLAQKHHAEFTLDQASEAQLKAYARFLGLSEFGGAFFIKRRLQQHLAFLDRDDAFLADMLKTDQKSHVVVGQDVDLSEALEERGISASLYPNTTDQQAVLRNWLQLRGFKSDEAGRAPPSE